MPTNPLETPIDRKPMSGHTHEGPTSSSYTQDCGYLQRQRSPNALGNDEALTRKRGRDINDTREDCAKHRRSLPSPPRTRFLEATRERKPSPPRPYNPLKRDLDRSGLGLDQPEGLSQSDATASRKRPRITKALDQVTRFAGTATPEARSKNRIRHWIRERNWPATDFRPPPTMNPLLGRKRSSSSLRGKHMDKSEASSRESSCPAVRSRLYEQTLKSAHIYMDMYTMTTTESCQTLCREMLLESHSTPLHSLFREDLFRSTCDRVRGENEAMVSRDITPLVVPPAEILYAFGDLQCDHLVGRPNTAWSRALVLVEGASPQPDYSVGLKLSAFTSAQLQKIRVLAAGSKKTLFMAMDDMYFPFLTCEVKCGNEALDVADRQNAHSSSFCVKALVSLYKISDSAMDLHRKLIAFSISHDNMTVRIYGHYALLDESDPRFYRHPVRTISIEDQEGKERWVAYKFTKSLYETFSQIHIARIREGLNRIPHEDGDATIDADVEPLLELDGIDSLSQSSLQSLSQSQSSTVRDCVPDTPASEDTGPASKKVRGSLSQR